MTIGTSVSSRGASISSSVKGRREGGRGEGEGGGREGEEGKRGRREGREGRRGGDMKLKPTLHTVLSHFAYYKSMCVISPTTNQCASFRLLKHVWLPICTKRKLEVSKVSKICHSFIMYYIAKSLPCVSHSARMISYIGWLFVIGSTLVAN